MVGGRQWRLRCYPTCMNDQQWMDVPNNIVVVPVHAHKSQMVSVSLLLWIHTLTHGDTVALYYSCQACGCFLPCRCEYYCVRWMELYILSSSYKRSLFHESGSTKKRLWGGASWHWARDLQWRSHTHIVCCYCTGGRLHLSSSFISTNKHMRKCCSPSPCGRCLPRRCRMSSDTCDTCRCGESILCDGGNAL
jgi:hypothetical protein